MTTETEYVTPREAADILDITTQAVYRLIQRGSLTEVRPWPRHVLIPKSEVLDRLTAPRNLGGRPRKPPELPIGKTVAKAYVLDRTEADDISEVGEELLFDLLYEFIAERRDTWSHDDRRIWAERTLTSIQTQPVS